MREAGWNRDADHAHLGEVGPLAAQQLLHVGAALGRAAAKGINVLFSVRHRSRSLQVLCGPNPFLSRWEAFGVRRQAKRMLSLVIPWNYRTLSFCTSAVKHPLARTRSCIRRRLDRATRSARSPSEGQTSHHSSGMPWVRSAPTKSRLVWFWLSQIFQVTGAGWPTRASFCPLCLPATAVRLSSSSSQRLSVPRS